MNWCKTWLYLKQCAKHSSQTGLWAMEGEGNLSGGTFQPATRDQPSPTGMVIPLARGSSTAGAGTLPGCLRACICLWLGSMARNIDGVSKETDVPNMDQYGYPQDKGNLGPRKWQVGDCERMFLEAEGCFLIAREFSQPAAPMNCSLIKNLPWQN